MFASKNEKIEKLVEKNPEITKKLEKIFLGKTNVYIDYANVAYWQSKLGWRFDIKRLKKFLDSFDNINAVKVYYGTLEGDRKSEELMNSFKKRGYDIRRQRFCRSYSSAYGRWQKCLHICNGQKNFQRAI